MIRVKNLFHRLDIQLSILVGGIVALWFCSFLFSASLLNKEHLEKNTYLEKERIKIKIESELTGILNDLLLDHRKSLELTLQDIHHSLGLSSISLRLRGGKTLRYGTTKVDGTHYVLEQEFPIRFDGKEYGMLSIGKELWIMNGSEAVPKKWIAGIAAAMVLIFYMIRLFIQKQIVTPLNLLIRSFSVERLDPEPVFRSHSSEMDEVIQNFRRMRQKLTDYQTKNVETERQAALGELAAQVAHDIRSPLTALSVVNENLSELPESKRALVRSAVSRIRDIANNLLEKKNAPLNAPADDETPSVQLISSPVESILSEKRLQFKSKIGVHLIFELDTPHSLFAKIQPVAFKRILSNLVNNAVEALPEAGEVGVFLSSGNGAVTLKISDNGKGIPGEIQERLFKKGATFEKVGGSGLGLYHAREKLSQWGGRISLESINGKGTTVSIFLPMAPKPVWFIDKLKISRAGIVGILDDDASIHLTWRKKFDGVLGGFQNLVHFSTPEELAEWTRVPANRAELFLVDYEIHSHVLNGLDVIESLGLEKKSILVTSHFDDNHIIDRCETLGVGLLAKMLASSVPVCFTEI